MQWRFSYFVAWPARTAAQLTASCKACCSSRMASCSCCSGVKTGVCVALVARVTPEDDKTVPLRAIPTPKATTTEKVTMTTNRRTAQSYRGPGRMDGQGRTAGSVGRPLGLTPMTDDRCPHGHVLSEAKSKAASHTQPVLFCQTCDITAVAS